MSQQEPKVAGVDILLGGNNYVLPPLPLVKLAKVQTLMKGGNVGEEAYVESLCNAIAWSLQRNYPDLTKEEVTDNLDMTNFQVVLDAFLEVNGFKKKDGSEPAGEATASQ